VRALHADAMNELLTKVLDAQPLSQGRSEIPERHNFRCKASSRRARNDHGDSDPTYGNGWAILKTRNQITVAEFIHRGDESTFTAQSG